MAFSLGGMPAKADAVVRGTWIIELPSGIRFRRYRSAAPHRTLSDVAHVDDSLEQGWRKLNSLNALGPTREVLHGLCCAVIQQQLWAFTASTKQTWPDLDYLRGDDEQSIVPADFVSCKQHGHSLKCLHNATSCEVQWDVSGDELEIWTALESACAETLSWRSGNRICMKPALVSISEAPLDVSLRPLPNGSLLLRSSERSQSWSKRIPHSHVLLPFNIKAIQLDASPDVSSTQNERLSSISDEILGYAWKDGRSDVEIVANLSDKPFSEWAIFWVSLRSSKDLGGEGVMTIWPTHLARMAVTSPSPSQTSVAPGPDLNPSSVSDLVSTAAAVYETLANGRDPKVADDALLFDEPMEPEPEPEAESLPLERGNSASDVNDLFSGTSSPPAPERFEDTVSELQMDEEPREVQELRELFKSPDIDMTERQELKGDPEATTEVGNMITEDDFNFFDSPADEDVDQDDAVMNGPTDITATTIAVPMSSSSPSEEGLATPSSPPRHDVTKSESPINIVITEEIHLPSDTNPSVGAAQPSEPLLDIIPDPFSPVSLIDTASPLPSAVYRLSGTQAYLEVHRKRADSGRRSPTADFRYATMWAIESDDSGSEDENEQDTRDPPTPRTDPDTASALDVPMHDEQPPAPSSLDIMPTFRDIPCVGPEWIAMLHLPEAGQDLVRPWEASWATAVPPNILSGSQPDQPEMPSVPLVSDLDSQTDLNRALNTLVASQHIRQLLLGSVGREVSSRLCPELTESGVRLADLVMSEQNPPLTDIGVSYTQPQIHVGFYNMITKMSIASLRFWRELNLQPAGGQKHTTAYVLCEDGNGWLDAASQFLAAMREGWEAYRFGVHQEMEDSVMLVHPSELAITLHKLYRIETDSTIYVLLSPNFNLSLIPQLFRQDLPPNPTCVIHIVPPHVIDMPPPSLLSDSYNLIPRGVRRVNSHRPSFFSNAAEPSGEVFMQYPHFTLAPDSPPKPVITLAWPVKSYDILNRWRLIHSAYAYDTHSGLVVTCAVDSQGDNWEVRYWIVQSAVDAVERVWEWSTQWAGAQSAEWRLGICRLGLMRADEYQAWRRYTSSKTPLTLLMSESPEPIAQLALADQRHGNVGGSILNDPATRLIDESMLGEYWPLPFRSAVVLPGTVSPKPTSSHDPVPEASDDEPATEPSSEAHNPLTLFLTTFILSQATPDANAHSATTYHLVAHQSPDDSAFKDEDPMALYGKEYHRLACYARARFGFESGLPAHLECVQAAKGLVEFFATHKPPAA